MNRVDLVARELIDDLVSKACKSFSKVNSCLFAVVNALILSERKIGGRFDGGWQKGAY